MAATLLPLSQRPWDIVFVVFFVIHIPTTLLLDSQVILPRQLFPKPLIDLLDFHINTNQDFLVGTKPVWFIALTLCELLFQFPYFFAATYAFVYGKEWIRMPSIIYAAHVVTTMVPILGALWFSSLSLPARLNLISIYMPYLIIPLILLYRVSVSSILFSSDKSRLKSE